MAQQTVHIQRILGEGGMGTVFEITESRLKLRAAMKVLKPGNDTKRFTQEAQNVAQLKHRNIVGIYQSGEKVSDVLKSTNIVLNGTYKNQPFIIMEYIEGVQLDEYLKIKTLSYLERARLFRDIANAVSYAHKKSIVHRDLKPSNILIREDGSPVIMDFGIAKCLDSKIQPDDLSKTGMILGTPFYMSPEQTRGSKGNIGPHTDVFSLGVMLYEMLTGKRPFDGESFTLLNKIINKNPTPPREVKDSIPEVLEQICLRSLNKKPEDRYKNAGVLERELDRFIGNKQTFAEKRKNKENGTKKVKQKVRYAPIIGAILFCIIGMMLSGIVILRETEKLKKEVASAKERIIKLEKENINKTDEMTTALSEKETALQALTNEKNTFILELNTSKAEIKKSAKIKRFWNTLLVDAQITTGDKNYHTMINRYGDEQYFKYKNPKKKVTQEELVEDLDNLIVAYKVHMQGKDYDKALECAVITRCIGLQHASKIPIKNGGKYLNILNQQLNDSKRELKLILSEYQGIQTPKRIYYYDPEK